LGIGAREPKSLHQQDASFLKDTVFDPPSYTVNGGKLRVTEKAKEFLGLRHFGTVYTVPRKRSVAPSLLAIVVWSTVTIAGNASSKPITSSSLKR
jgi:hypothetical protein